MIVGLIPLVFECEICFIFKFVEAGSSRSSLLLHFVGMGFSEDTVAKAIKDNGLFFFLFFIFWSILINSCMIYPCF